MIHCRHPMPCVKLFHIILLSGKDTTLGAGQSVSFVTPYNPDMNERLFVERWDMAHQRPDEFQWVTFFPGERHGYFASSRAA
jgi:hypothetical protein